MIKGLAKKICLSTFVISSLFFGKATLIAKVSVSEQVSKDFTAVAKKAIPAVVSIQIKAKDKDSSRMSGNPTSSDPLQDFFQDDFFEHFFGRRKQTAAKPREPQVFIGQASGFIVSKDGTIITNNHVVSEASEILVILNDGREFDAKVIGKDPNTDLAVIKIDGDNNFPYLELGNSDNLEVGQWVVAIGNPLGLQASLTVGVVSAKGRNNLDLVRIEDFIQTDATINRGNSGGPLLNLEGDVIGVNTAIASNLSSGGYIGIGFAIPSNMATNVLEQLMKNGSVSRGYLGVILQEVDKGLAQAFGLDRAEGALLAEVQKGSAAENAGLKQGDIILKYNNNKVTNLAGLRNAIAMMPPKTKVLLSYLRDGKLQETTVELGFLAGDALEKGNQKATESLGITVEPLTKEIASNLGLLSEKGVVVSSVDSGSAASFAGIKKGALILSVNQRNVTTPEEFKQYIKETPAGKPVLFLIKQGELTRYISIKVG